MELRIYLRQTQVFAIQTISGSNIVQGAPIVYAGLNPASLLPVSGTVPSPNWIDFTDSVGNLDAIQLTWTSTRDGSGTVVPGATLPKKTASNQINIEGDGYKFIKAWLIDNVAAPLNSIDVRIDDVGCGSYLDYIIKPSQVSWCDNVACQFDVTLKQKDIPMQCIQENFISDNWQGWFQSQPENGKKHPRFVYCNEVNPDGMMIALWWLMIFVFDILMVLSIAFNAIVLIINAIISLINGVISLFGGHKLTHIQYINVGSMASTFYLESSGCGRMHPAPLIRDYIDNICKKCGIEIDAQTDPIFHSKTITLTASSGHKDNVPNPYYNACYLNAPAKKGIRIFNSQFGQQPDLTTYYIEGNKPIIGLDAFLDQLKSLFNAEWRIANISGVPHLYFWRKDWYAVGTALYDFTDNANDRTKILTGICYTWADKKSPANIQGLYSSDGIDSCGNESIQYMNDVIKTGDETDNLIYSGSLDKTSFSFGATKFRLDGASDDYLFNAVQSLLNAALLTPGAGVLVANAIVPSLKKYADYALLLYGETAALAKVLIWDENTGFDYAKAVHDKSTFIPSVNGSQHPLPDPNPAYNPNLYPWFFYHMPETYVKGSQFTIGNSPQGKYTAQEYFGIDFYARPAELCNYPMFFASGFKDNLWDWFHYIDDPSHYPNLNLEWEVKIDLCCDDLKLLKVFGDGTDVQLYGRVKLPIQYYGEGKITEITVSYDSGSDGDTGKYIELKGIT